MIALHGGVGTLSDLEPLARSLSPYNEVIAVEAPRRVHYVERIAYTWYDAQELNHPEPVTFGDCLVQLEQLVYEISEANSGSHEPIYLLGLDQGAVLALALSLVLPDYLSGVVAICGCLPKIAVWPLPERPLNRLPLLLVYDNNDAELTAALVQATETELVKRDGAPTLIAVKGARGLGSNVSTEVQDWLQGRDKCRPG